MFAELCLASDPENPAPTMDQFFGLYQSLRNASSVVHSIPWLRGQEDSDICSDENKLKSASTWVNAALSVDLASISHFSKQFASVLKTSSPVKVSLIPQSGGHYLSKKANESSISSQLASAQRVASSPSVRRTPLSTPQKGFHGSERLSVSQELRNPSPLKTGSLKRSLGTSGAENIVKAAGFLLGDASSKKSHGGGSSTTTLELTNLLRNEMQSWFLQFVEKALEFGFRLSFIGSAGNGGVDVVTVDGSSELKIAQKESNVIALMLSQIKRVNDWVDVIESDKEKPLDLHVVQILDRVKRKVYEFLLQHVESAATTLGKCI